MQQASHIAFGVKTYYRPIEAAIRWCGLTHMEPCILETVGQRALPQPQDFPGWPMLRLSAERIFDALAHGELPCGKGGIVQQGPRPALDDPALIVRHVDLKAWMTRYYPGERPPFLFDGIERDLHPAASRDMLNVLLAEREAIKAQFAQLAKAHDALHAAHDALEKEYAGRIAESESQSLRELGQRGEST